MGYRQEDSGLILSWTAVLLPYKFLSIIGLALSFPSNFVFHGQYTIAVHKETTMFKIPKQAYTDEFKAQAVTRVTAVGSMSRVADDLGLVEQT